MGPNGIFYMLYSIGPINVCTDFEINRYKIDEVRKYANIALYLIYLTSRDAKTLRHASWGLRHFYGFYQRVQHVGQEMLTLSGTPDLTPFWELVILPIHYMFITECVSLVNMFTI